MFPWSFGEDVAVRVGLGPGITEVGDAFSLNSERIEPKPAVER
jgi:hypothetical protein